MYRQGDLLFVPIAAIPAVATPVRDGVIARGEVTGHAHRLQISRGRTLLIAAGVMYIRAMNRVATVDHEEHGPIALPPGNYEVRRQREYEPAGWRNVSD